MTRRLIGLALLTAAAVLYAAWACAACAEWWEGRQAREGRNA